MPIYEYECTGCGDRSEVLQRMADPAPEGCGKCGEPLKRLLSAPSFQFKGSGWYVTDYAGKGEDKSKAGDDKTPKSDTGSSEGDSGKKSAGASKDAKPSSSAGDKTPTPSSKSAGSTSGSD